MDDDGLMNQLKGHRLLDLRVAPGGISERAELTAVRDPAVVFADFPDFLPCPGDLSAGNPSQADHGSADRH
jgi:hypothetical protein